MSDEVREMVSNFRKACVEFGESKSPDNHARMIEEQRALIAFAEAPDERHSEARDLAADARSDQPSNEGGGSTGTSEPTEERFVPEGRCTCAGPDGPCETCEANREAYEEWKAERATPKSTGISEPTIRCASQAAGYRYERPAAVTHAAPEGTGTSEPAACYEYLGYIGDGDRVMYGPAPEGNECLVYRATPKSTGTPPKAEE